METAAAIAAVGGATSVGATATIAASRSGARPPRGDGAVSRRFHGHTGLPLSDWVVALQVAAGMVAAVAVSTTKVAGTTGAALADAGRRRPACRRRSGSGDRRLVVGTQLAARILWEWAHRHPHHRHHHRHTSGCSCLRLCHRAYPMCIPMGPVGGRVVTTRAGCTQCRHHPEAWGRSTVQ